VWKGEEKEEKIEENSNFLKNYISGMIGMIYGMYM